MDIFFYDFDMKLVYILPPSAKTNGYTSMNATIEFNGVGSFELAFWDAELKSLVRSYPEGMFIKWGVFEGYMTDWQFKDKECKLFGKHINSLLHKRIIPKTNGAIEGNVEDLIYSKITEGYDFLTLKEEKGIFGEVTFWRNTYKYGDEYIGDLAARGGAGYMLKLSSDGITFELLPTRESSLMISENNLNAYDVQEDFDAKNAADGGWYRKETVPEETDPEETTPEETETWEYISGSEATGLYRNDIIFSASTASEARYELKKKKAKHEYSAKVKGLKYDADYLLGDKLRLQIGNETITKYVTSVNLWHENGAYNEQPILGELKEVTSDE